jgi:hypothetical protein
LSDELYRSALLDDATKVAADSTNFSPNLSVDHSSKKAIYSAKRLAEKLVLRKCAENINLAGKITYPQRKQIIDELKVYLKDGCAYRVFRLDILSFFEHCSVDVVLAALENYALSTHTRLLVESFLRNFHQS